jgi:hypothetical protein
MSGSTAFVNLSDSAVIVQDTTRAFSLRLSILAKRPILHKRAFFEQLGLRQKLEVHVYQRRFSRLHYT